MNKAIKLFEKTGKSHISLYTTIIYFQKIRSAIILINKKKLYIKLKNNTLHKL